VQVRLRVQDGGTAHLVVVDSDGVAGAVVSRVARTRSGLATVRVPLDRALVGAASVLVGWDDRAGGTFSSKVPVRGR